MSDHLREDQIVPYLDARLGPDERARLESHVAACADCAARLEELRLLWSTLAEWKAVEPSPGFDAALRARLAEERAEKRPWFVLRPAYAAALAAALLLAAISLLWQPEPPAISPTPTAPAIAERQPEAAPTVPTTPATPERAETDELAVLDNPVLLDNYDLLAEFDILFETAAKEEERKL